MDIIKHLYGSCQLYSLESQDTVFFNQDTVMTCSFSASNIYVTYRCNRQLYRKQTKFHFQIYYPVSHLNNDPISIISNVNVDNRNVSNF